MTKISIALLREGENPYKDYFLGEELDIKIEGGTLSGEVEIQGVLMKSLPYLELSGTVDFRMDCECARCLKRFTREFRVSIRCRYQQVNELRPGWEVASDMRYVLASARELDILPEVREAVLFTTPLVTFCREDCPGLCPRCGADLSLGPCDCKPLERDTPWEALKQMKMQ